MAMATCSRWNLLLVVLVVVAAAGVDYTAAFDQDHTDWMAMPTTDLDAPRMQELARWAVQKHNEQGVGEPLLFLRLTSGQYQIEAPALNYRYVIQTTNVDGVISEHIAQVFVQYWTNTQRLDSFT